MGACIAIGGKPVAINIQLPGGAAVGSMASGTQQVPNDMDPFQSLIQGVQPALSSLQPAFNIIGFVMALMNLQVKFMTLLGALASVTMPGNPISIMFPVPNLKDEDGNEISPPVPDLMSILPGVLEALVEVICKALKLAGLVPQLSGAMTIKDSLITAMGFADAAMGQVNSLTDLFTGLPPANTGNPVIDQLLQCAVDNSGMQLEHKLGPVGNLVPLMSVVSIMADLAKQPLPPIVATLVKLVANGADGDPPGFGVIPFPDLSSVGGPTSDEQRETFIGLIEDMTVSGLPIEIPDFSDLSKLGDTLTELQDKMRPLLPIIELLQTILDKLTKC